MSIDWGGVDPFSIGVWQEAPEELGGKGTWIRVTELYLQMSEESTTNTRLIEQAKTMPWWRLIKEVIPDNSRPDLIQEWRVALPAGVTMTVIDKKTIDEGIERVKSNLSPVIGLPKLLFNRSCLHSAREVGMYKVKNDKPVDKDNHTWDEIRYFVLAKMSAGAGIHIGSPSRDVMPE